MKRLLGVLMAALLLCAFAAPMSLSAAYVPVFEIVDTSALAEAGRPLTLKGTVTPTNATNKAIQWEVVNAGTTGATIEGNVFTASSVGTATLNAVVIDGDVDDVLRGPDYRQVVNITVIPTGSFKAVERIDGIAETLDLYPMGVPYLPYSLTLAAEVVPANATSRQIGWAVVSGNSALGIAVGTGDVIIQFLGRGNLRLAAIIIDGTDIGVDYVQYFDIVVGDGEEPPPPGILGTNPRYNKWYHYILFFFAFGFIWMWF